MELYNVFNEFEYKKLMEARSSNVFSLQIKWLEISNYIMGYKNYCYYIVGFSLTQV